MSAFSDYAENAVGNLLLRGQSLTPPANIYLALFTDDPTDADAGTEVSGGSYARKAITFDAPTDGAFANSADILFSDMPAATVTHWAIYDASTGGNMLYHDAWGSSKTYPAGEAALVSAGQLVITHD